MFFLLARCVAAEGQMDCVLLLVNMEHSADIIDSPDTQGQWVTSLFNIDWQAFPYPLVTF